MTILVKPVQRVNPQDVTAKKKWYPVQSTVRQVDESEVAMEIADETTLNASEALMAIRQLRKIMQRHLLNSESVQLGDRGSFYTTLSTIGAVKREDLTARNIKAVNIVFQPGSELKSAMQKATFAWLNKVAEGKQSATTSPDSGSTGSGGEGGTSDETTNPMDWRLRNHYPIVAQL